jgi:hypothetical protein
MAFSELLRVTYDVPALLPAQVFMATALLSYPDESNENAKNMDTLSNPGQSVLYHVFVVMNVGLSFIGMGLAVLSGVKRLVSAAVFLTTLNTASIGNCQISCVSYNVFHELRRMVTKLTGKMNHLHPCGLATISIHRFMSRGTTYTLRFHSSAFYCPRSVESGTHIHHSFNI